jgi:hypothetical protein
MVFISHAILAAHEADDEWKGSERKYEIVKQHVENPAYLIVTGPLARAEA